MYYTVKLNSYTPTIEDPNPEGLLRSSLDSKSSNLAGVMSRPALAGENSRMPTPLSLMSSSLDSNDIDMVGPSSWLMWRRNLFALEGRNLYSVSSKKIGKGSYEKLLLQKFGMSHITFYVKN